MQIDKIMHRNVKSIGPDETLRDAATAMKKLDVGVLPVGEHDKLVGMITDRDIAIRGIAEGKGPDTKAREVMSQEVKYCFEDEAVEHVAENMAELQVRRLPVLNRYKSGNHRPSGGVTLLMRAKETDTHMVVSDLVRAFGARLRDRQ